MAGSKPRLLTQEQMAWVAERYADTTNAELVEQLQDEFGITLTRDKIAAWARRQGLRKSEETMQRTRAEGWRKFTDEMCDFVREFVPGHVYPETAAEFERRFGWRISKTQYKNLMHRLGVRSGVKGYGCFEKGHEPPNKGKTWDDYLSPETQQKIRESGNLFVKGQKSHNEYHELLDTRQDKSGTWIYVKPRDAKYSAQFWISYSRFVWMQANGREFPVDCRCVHCNHDKDDFRPENLMAVPNDVYGIVTSGTGNSLEYWDRESLKRAIVHAKLMMTVREKESRKSRRCTVCGRVFKPAEHQEKYAYRVRICDECRKKGLRPKRKRRKEPAA